MDKDTTILKYDQQILEETSVDIDSLKKNNDLQEKKLQELQNQLSSIKKDISQKNKKSLIKVFNRSSKIISEKSFNSYDKLFEISYNSLVERGIAPDDISIYDFVSEEEIGEIIKDLNAPLPREDKWTKADFITVFIAAIIGSVIDFILGNRNNDLTGQKSKFSDWLNDKFHEGHHATNAPIDYQGEGFGGGYHRELSRGHDLLRFVDGIKMFKEGKFEGVTFVDGVAKKVIKTTNQYGTPYAQLSTIEALLNYSQHMFADLFSKVSLPLPGYSFFRECDSREIRKFASDLYHNGFNCKNVMIQSASTISIELIIRIFFSIQSVKKYKANIEVAEDYSNFEALKTFVSPPSKEKLNEMLLVAHSIVTAINVGKIIIVPEKLATINVTEIMSVVKYGIQVSIATAKRYDKYARLIYHANDIDSNWHSIDESVTNDTTEIIKDIPDLILA